VSKLLLVCSRKYKKNSKETVDDIGSKRGPGMHLICSYCNRYIKEKKPFEVTSRTHGICPDCYVQLLKQNEGLSHDEYLETFDVPVVIVDSQRRITAANQAALGMIEKPIERVVGILGGEALECLHSKLPEGCGRTIHCETCLIRILILKTIDKRTSHYNELVSMETKSGRSDFLVSAIFFDDLVQIVFEDCLENNG
jgi:PAS domain-containing protein